MVRHRKNRPHRGHGVTLDNKTKNYLREVYRLSDKEIEEIEKENKEQKILLKNESRKIIKINEKSQDIPHELRINNKIYEYAGTQETKDEIILLKIREERENPEYTYEIVEFTKPKFLAHKGDFLANEDYKIKYAIYLREKSPEDWKIVKM